MSNTNEFLGCAVLVALAVQAGGDGELPQPPV